MLLLTYTFLSCRYSIASPWTREVSGETIAILEGIDDRLGDLINTLHWKRPRPDDTKLAFLHLLLLLPLWRSSLAAASREAEAATTSAILSHGGE